MDGLSGSTLRLQQGRQLFKHGLLLSPEFKTLPWADASCKIL